MSRILSTTIACIGAFSLLGTGLLFAQGSKSPRHTITADAGTLHLTGDTFKVSFTKNVQLMSTNPDALVICQALTAEGSQGQITSAEASDEQSWRDITLVEDGKSVEYRVFWRGVLRMVDSDGTMKYKLSKEKNGTTPKLSMAPKTNLQDRRFEISADAIDFMPEPDTKLPASFFKATGAVVVTLREPGKGTVTGSAPQITGTLEQMSGETVQVVRMVSTAKSPGIRPHLGLDAATVADDTSVDADTIILFPAAQNQAAKRWPANGSGQNTTPVLAVKASGNAVFKTGNAKQILDGQAGELQLSLEKKNGSPKPGATQGYDRVLRLLRNGGKFHVVMVEKKTGKQIAAFVNDPAYYNLDTGEFGTGELAEGNEE